MDWRETIAKSGAFLVGKGVDDGAAAAEHLAARLLRCSRPALVAHMGEQVPERFLDAMRRGVKRLAAHEPLQYVIGEWDFRFLTLKCDKRALIPRPETEGLVSLVLKHLETREGVPFVVDVGTGTGAIILSLAKELKRDAILLGSDVSEDAIALAKENAARTGLESKVKFVAMDGLDDFDEPGLIDVIVSNPPYIKTSVCETLDRRVKDYEPRLALDGGASGLDFYDRYLADALNLLRPGGAVFFEIGDDQGEDLRRLFAAYGFEQVEIGKDLAGKDRYASAVLP